MVNNFVDWIEVELGKREWTRAELARRAGVNQSSLSLIYSGERKPGPDICEAIAKAFRIPPEIVFRKAGLLPEKTDTDETSQEIVHIAHLLTEENRDDLLAYARFRLQAQEGRGDGSSPPNRPSRQAP